MVKPPLNVYYGQICSSLFDSQRSILVKEEHFEVRLRAEDEYCSSKVDTEKTFSGGNIF